jgi:hypothetical protein
MLRIETGRRKFSEGMSLYSSNCVRFVKKLYMYLSTFFFNFPYRMESFKAGPPWKTVKFYPNKTAKHLLFLFRSLGQPSFHLQLRCILIERSLGCTTRCRLSWRACKCWRRSWCSITVSWKSSAPSSSRRFHEVIEYSIFLGWLQTF